MKVKTLIEYLEEFDPNSIIEITDMSDLYEFFLLSITERDKTISFNTRFVLKDIIKDTKQ